MWIKPNHRMDAKGAPHTWYEFQHRLHWKKEQQRQNELEGYDWVDDLIPDIDDWMAEKTAAQRIQTRWGWAVNQIEVLKHDALARSGAASWF